MTALSQQDYKKYVGSLVMLSFACIAMSRWLDTKAIYFLLYCMRDTIAAFFLFKRKEAVKTSTSLYSVIAYASSGLPLLYIAGSASAEVKLAVNLLAVLGFLIVTWATIDLGLQFGVSPAKRGDKCIKGLYKYISHPMYAGYAIAQLGWLFINKWNILIFLISMALFMIRAREENKVLV